jgi:hypothetical protein
MDNEKIILNQSRDFGETFNVSIKFIRQNFKLLFTCIILLAGPFLLFHGVATTYYESVVIYKKELVHAGRLYNMNAYGIEYFVSLILGFVSYTAIMCTTYGYMVVYNQKGFGNFTVNDVRKKVGEHFGKIIATFFLFLILILIFGVVIGAGVILLWQASIVAGLLLSFVLAIGILILGPNFFWQISTSFLVIIYKTEQAFWAFGKTRSIMKDSYWWTWLLVVCASLIVYFIALMFALPAGIFAFIKLVKPGSPEDGNSIIFLAVFLISSFCASLVYTIQYVFYGFHFFSLEEKKEGKGLMERINEIGITQSNDVTQQY